MDKCPKCGNSLDPGAAFCDNCGYILNNPKSSSKSTFKEESNIVLKNSKWSSIIFGFVLFYISTLVLDSILVVVLQQIYNLAVIPLLKSPNFLYQLHSYSDLTAHENALNKLKITHSYLYITCIIFALLEFVIYEYLFTKIHVKKSILSKTLYLVAPTIHFIVLVLLPYRVSLNSEFSYFLEVFVGMSILVGICIHLEVRTIIIYFNSKPMLVSRIGAL